MREAEVTSINDKKHAVEACSVFINHTSIHPFSYFGSGKCWPQNQNWFWN